MKLKKIVSSMLAVMALGAASASHAAILTDIVMIVDESGSMGTVQANLRNNIGLFANILSAGGIDARFALIGYGNSSIVPRTLTTFTTAGGFATAALGLQINGGTEPGYTSIAYALNAFGTSGLTYRPNAVTNVILFTDEPSNGDTVARFGIQWTKDMVDELLTDSNALFNAVLSGTSTINSYGSLATDHGGQVFALSGLNTSNQTVVENFVTAFAEAKLQETLTFCQLNPTAPQCQGNTVPEPGSMALIGLGLLGMAGLRRKFKGNNNVVLAVA